MEGFAGYDDVRLKTAIKVPKAFVGRIIGKGGKTVRDIQHVSGVIIKLPSNAADEAEEEDDGVFVTAYGSFIATQVFTLFLYASGITLRFWKSIFYWCHFSSFATAVEVIAKYFLKNVNGICNKIM